MRLTQIKLSGFKSFVDPTNFHIPGQLVGVVGPNGCGKSNIIDAARWVLGESKASELRGESMQDVIFNGSGNRKPAGRASVELVFDNAAGRAGGQWGQYAEIAVKRVLTRDGNSSYFINNQVVRRRDVHDIFLGTGLGPRAYAIIGQGMISRIIEAKPEELRVFLEEAAGVSKYKERRRETENRLNDTRENLTRVEDILRELGANLDKLEAQARVAQQYRDLEAEHALKEKLLWLLRRDEAQLEQTRQQRAIEEVQLRLESRTAALRHCEARLEELRALHFAAGDAVQASQAGLFEAAATVSEFESEIRRVLESRKRLESQLGQLTGQREHWQRQHDDGQTDLERAEATLEEARLERAAGQAALSEHAKALPEVEMRQRALQAEVDAAKGVVLKVEQALQLEAAQQRNADRNLEQIAQRRERLDDERRGLAAPDLARIEALQVEVRDGSARLAALNEELAAAEAGLPALSAARDAAQEAVTRDGAQLAQSEARLAALVQLQQSVQTQDRLQPWLERHELTRLPRLWQRLHVEPGWETALEAVLRERIAALEVSQIELTRGFFGDAPPAKLTFFGGVEPHHTQPAAPAAGLVPLASRLRLDDAALRTLLTDWLAGVYIADSHGDAFARRHDLPEGASFVVREGHRIGRNSVRFHASDSEQSGMLARQQEIESLGKQSRAEALIAGESRSHAVQCEAALSAAAATLSRLRGATQDLTRALHGRQLELQRLEQQRLEVETRSGRIAAESAELGVAYEQERALRAASEARFEAFDKELGEAQARHEERLVAFEAASRSLDEARATLRHLERRVQEGQFAERNALDRIAGLQGAIELAAAEVARVDAALGAARAELETLSDLSAQAGLQQALQQRVEREEALRRARTEMDGLASAMREADDERLRTERELEPLRLRITELQLKEQAARLNQEQYSQKLEEAQADLDALGALLGGADAARHKPAQLQLELQRIRDAIVALGAVNLAALEELTAARDRKVFLDAQSSDLNEAISTLEDAIRKIDRETRHLLQETFDAVNRHFGELFPALFGGGEARLVMTGEEILDAGVQVMAQPPGKKNSTIHLLSGGEKALAATALVFGMFQLNPAPFCLLDEVDAPLDDANTERFCNLVRRMSAQTQFLFISHNKIAMEMAHQLIGVTMQEQGVSRVVAVDMDQAVELTREPMEKVA